MAQPFGIVPFARAITDAKARWTDRQPVGVRHTSLSSQSSVWLRLNSCQIGTNFEAFMTRRRGLPTGLDVAGVRWMKGGRKANFRVAVTLP